jgi:hypothetical protein
MFHPGDFGQDGVLAAIRESGHFENEFPALRFEGKYDVLGDGEEHNGLWIASPEAH